MDPSFDIAKLLVLRKVTRSAAEHFGQQLNRYLGTLSPLLQPRNVLGENVCSATKLSVKGEAEAFEELKRLYTSLAGTRQFSMRNELQPPLDIVSRPLGMTPADYHYVPEGSDRPITITSPFRWVLTLGGWTPQQLREAVAQPQDTTGDVLQRCVLHFLALHITLAKRPSVVQLLEGLRFPLGMETFEEFGDLPFCVIRCPVVTMRPPDEVLIQSTELSGMSAFEEVVDLEGFRQMRDPLHEQLAGIIKSHDESLLPEGPPRS